MIFGVEAVTEMVHVGPYIYEYLRAHGIYEICGGKDHTIALGVQAKDSETKPVIGVDEKMIGDVRQRKISVKQICN